MTSSSNICPQCAAPFADADLACPSCGRSFLVDAGQVTRDVQTAFAARAFEYSGPPVTTSPWSSAESVRVAGGAFRVELTAGQRGAD